MGDGGIPLRREPRAGRPGLGDGRAAVARGGGRGRHPYGGWRDPATGLGWSQMRTLARRLGTTLAVAGVLLVVYAAHGRLLARSGDEHLHRLRAARDERAAAATRSIRGSADARSASSASRSPTPPGTHGGATVTPAVKQRRGRCARHAGSRSSSRPPRRATPGRPLGRIQIKRIGLSTIVVENTDYWGSLSKGPGRYEQGSFPGLGQTTGIAGHRTTFAAPFRHIDSIRDGDSIVVQMPYGTFTYRVLRHKIVDNGDWSIMQQGRLRRARALGLPPALQRRASATSSSPAWRTSSSPARAGASTSPCRAAAADAA